MTTKDLKHIPVTDFNLPKNIIRNHKALSAFFDKFEVIPEKQEFDMLYYYGKSSGADENSTDCGTCGCAAGYGPFAGIPKLAEECWITYAKRVFFGFEKEEDFDVKQCALFEFLFGGDWSSVNNTPEGFVARSRYFFKNGLPYLHKGEKDWYWGNHYATREAVAKILGWKK